MTIFGSNKLLRHLDRLGAYQRGEHFAPVTMEMDLTDRCNHACPECAGGRQGGELSWEEAEDYLRQMAEFGVRAVTFTGGGEPTLHPRLDKLLASAHEKGLDAALITNGSRMTKDLAETVAKCCVWCRVSIDGATPEQFRLTHGVGEKMFDAAWKAVQLLAEARDAANSQLTVGIGYLVDERTKPGMFSAAVKARNTGANYIQFRPFHWHPTPIADILPVLRQFETDRFRVLSSSQKYDRPRNGRGYTTCHGSYFCGVIQANAELALCCHYRGMPEYSLGSLRQATFADLWNGPRRKQILDRLDVNTCLPLCRLDSINLLLEDAVTEKEHKNFL